MRKVIRRPALPGTLLTALLIASPLLAAPMTALAQQQAPQNRLDVQAQSEIQVSPDEAMLSARLWERTPAIAQQDNTSADPKALSEARQRLEDRAAKLIQTLEAAGLEREAISAGSLRVQPEMIQASNASDDNPAAMTRTRLERPFEVEVQDLDQLPVILDALTEAGVNALDGVTYDLSDRDQATHQALTQALEKARDKAELMASTLDVTLGNVINISENSAPVFQPRMMAMSADAARESGGTGAEYRPGTISVDAMVSVSWEIQPSE